MAEKKMENIVQRFKFECEERKKIEKKLKQRLIFEKTVSTVSSRFIAVKNINLAINQTLRDIGRLSGASRAYIFFFSKDGKIMSNTHEWCRKNVSPQIKNLQNIPSNSLPWWVAQLRKGNTIHITDVSKMPKAAKATQKLLKSQSIKSLLVIPLHTGGKLIGFAGFDDVAQAGEWNDDDLMLLRICSEIVGKALESERSNDKLKESEKKFRVLAEENPVMIYIHDFNGIVYANQRAADVMGYTCKQGYSKNFDFMKLVAPEFRPDIRKFIIKNMEGKDVEPFECVLITQKGKRLDVIMTTKLIQYRGRPAALGMVTDITERKEAEKQIRESEAKFRILFNTAKDAIFINDKTGRFIDVNNAACKSLGYTKDELLKLSNKDIDDDPIGYQEFKKIRDGKIKEAKFEIKQRRKDGTYNYVEIMGSSFESRGQQVFLAIARDITERKNAETKIREYTEKLETKVQERTQELSKLNNKLHERIDDLEKFHNLAVGRELKMIELKEKIKKLQKRLDERKHD